MLWIHYGGYVFTQVYLFVCLFVCQQDDTETTKLDFNRTWMLARIDLIYFLFISH